VAYLKMSCRRGFFPGSDVVEGGGDAAESTGRQNQYF
jgi:hypothetical protein